MPNFRHLYKPIPKDSDKSEDIPPGTKEHLPRIRKCPRFVLAELGEEGKLQPKHPRFGPFYREDESKDSGKKISWDNILEKAVDKKKILEDKRNKTLEDEERNLEANKKRNLEVEKKILEVHNETFESYLSAMRRIEKDARDAYGDRALHNITESQFRLMMIKDGCFFLQLALLILGVSSEELGYPDDDPIFGKKQRKENIKRWMESMFFVGNQIPLVVLHELMEQTFFQDILMNATSWDVPSEVFKRILYEFLVLPATGSSKRRTSPQPRDLLHALHCLMINSRGGLRRDLVQDETGNDDLESGPNNESKDKNFSATELEKKGIRFGKLEKMGSREIEFKDCKIFARLCVPTFVVDHDTEAVWKRLKHYEMTQQQGKGKSEVRSYLHFMNDLICSYEDVKILANEGIIKVNFDYDKEKLPMMLSKLAGKDKSNTRKHHLVRIKLRDYTLAPWEKFKTVAILLFLFTGVQAFFAVLAYFRPPHQK